MIEENRMGCAHFGPYPTDEQITVYLVANAGATRISAIQFYRRGGKLPAGPAAAIVKKPLARRARAGAGQLSIWDGACHQ
jgi:hypothetical protein